jgi:hypothetical protein
MHQHLATDLASFWDWSLHSLFLIRVWLLLAQNNSSVHTFHYTNIDSKKINDLPVLSLLLVFFNYESA